MKAVCQVSVATYIKSQVAIAGISQKCISTALNYENPNVVSMIKTGATKLPINKVGPLAKVLKVDPVYLLRLTLCEYWPDTFESIQDLIGKSLVSDNEMDLIQLVRSASKGIDIALNDQADRDAIAKVIGEIAKTQSPHLSTAAT